jgi:hypothetical protein
VRSVIVSLTFEPDATRHFRLPADGSPSLLYVFGPDHKLGARAYSAIGQDFEPGSTQSGVRLDFWADDPWTDVVVPGGRPSRSGTEATWGVARWKRSSERGMGQTPCSHVSGMCGRWTSVQRVSRGASSIGLRSRVE